MVLRYLALHYLGANEYKNCSIDEYLNKAMVFLNEQDDDFIKQCKELYFDSLDCIYHIFGRYAFRRISKIRPQDLKPINTALFEGWLNGVSNLSSKERELLIQKKKMLKIYTLKN